MSSLPFNQRKTVRIAYCENFTDDTFACDILIIEYDKQNKYEDTLFTKCKFPNLRRIIFHPGFPVDENSDEDAVLSRLIKYEPFVDCEFNSVIHLIFRSPGYYILPEMLIRSIQVSVPIVKLSIGDDTRTFNEPIFHIEPFDISLDMHCGDDPLVCLPIYEKEFYIDKAEVNVCPYPLIESYKMEVFWTGNDKEYILGVATINVKKDPLAQVILLCRPNNENEDLKLEFDGDVPSNWPNQYNITSSVTNKLRQIRVLIINGSIQANGFDGVELNLKLLKADRAEAKAFENAWGWIDRLELGEVYHNTFDYSEVEVDTLYIQKLPDSDDFECDLYADTIILDNSQDVRHVSSARTLVIQEVFDEPMDVGHVDNLTIIDLRTVKSEGPFTILNFNENTRISLDLPDRLFRTYYNSLAVKLGEEPYEQLNEILYSKFAVNYETVYRFKTNGHEDVNPGPIYSSGVMTGYFNIDNVSTPVAKWYVTIDQSTQMLYWGISLGVLATSLILPWLFI